MGVTQCDVSKPYLGSILDQQSQAVIFQGQPTETLNGRLLASGSQC